MDIHKIDLAELIENVNKYKQIRQRLQTKNNYLKALTECRRVIVNCNNEISLTEEVADIITKILKYELVWIGKKVENKNKDIEIISYRGFEKNYIDTLQVSWDDSPYGNGPAGTSIKTGKIVSIGIDDPNFKPWKNIAQKHGFLSVCFIPLIIRNNVIGTIGFYSSKRKIGRMEREILQTIANDLSQGLQNLRDIEFRRRTEWELKMLSAVVEQNPHYIFITNKNAEIEYTNPAFTKITGYTFEEIKGQNPRFLKSGKVKQEVYKELWTTIKTGNAWNGEIINRYKDGTEHYEKVLISPLKNGNNEIVQYFTIKEDITKTKLSERALKKAKEEAELANKAKSEFLANMSHEIRTPLNSVLGFSEVLLSEIEDEKQRNYLSTIASSGRSLLNIINDILDLSKIEAGKLEIKKNFIDLRSMLYDLRQIFVHKAREKGLECKTEFDELFPDLILIDEIKLNQILLNLAGNAVKFTENGFIECRVYTTKIEKEKIDFVIDIIDTGIGIPESQKERIFDAFSQQSNQDSRKYEGTGLGLAICKRLIELMGGKILLESEVGKGSKFSLVFQEIETQNTTLQTKKEKPLQLENIQFEKSSILIVDDISLNIELIKSFLRKQNIEVLEANSGEMALSILYRASVDLIIMDLVMPGLDGFETTKRIQTNEKTKNIPVICYTASLIHNKQKCDLNIFHDFVPKPIQKDKLYTSLMNFLPYVNLPKQETKVETQTISIKNDFDKLNVIDKEKMKRIIQSELLEDIDNLILMNSPDDYEVFLPKVENFIRRFELKSINPILDDLRNYTQNFDFLNSEQKLKELKKIIQLLTDSV